MTDVLFSYTYYIVRYRPIQALKGVFSFFYPYILDQNVHFCNSICILWVLCQWAFYCSCYVEIECILLLLVVLYQVLNVEFFLHLMHRIYSLTTFSWKCQSLIQIVLVVKQFCCDNICDISYYSIVYI